MIWNKMETKSLCYGNWDISKSTIKASIFGVLVELSENRITNYRSDLWHDALWIDINITGPTSFEWVVRDYGTHIGEAAEVYDIERHGEAIKYRFDLEDNDGRWNLTIYEGSPELVPNVPDTIAAIAAMEQDLMETVPGYLETVQPISPKFREYTDEDKQAMLDVIFPIHGNDETIEKGNNMSYDLNRLIDALREKLDDANTAKEELEERQSSIEDAVSDLESYIDEMERIVGSLDELPECSVYVELDTVSFDSN